MSGADETRQATRRPRGAKPPKGRPTPGRRTRNAEARAQARRHRMIVRAWWLGATLVIVGIFTALIMTGVGTGGTSGLG